MMKISPMSPIASLASRLMLVAVAAASAAACADDGGTAAATAPPAASQRARTPSETGAGRAAWGTFLKPFAADSPWNSRPVRPVFGDARIPTSDFFPAIQNGAYSTAVFLAKSTDPGVTIGPLPNQQGVYDPDGEERVASVRIPHWPADTLGATGGDGHADIIDQESGIVYSFWQLRNIGGEWHAAQYAWSSLAGRGWGDPAHYFQGARAAGVPTTGGLIRTQEVDDGEAEYHHVLAMSLTFNGLSASPTYVFPATSSDTTAATTNSGSIPMGSLMMLPPDFDVSSIANLRVRKVAQTLKDYGAYVVDRNRGTPFVIYVEIGREFSLHTAAGKWDDVVARDLHRIREQLRPVVSAAGWVDGNGRHFTPNRRFNLLSMRGPWHPVGTGNPGHFDTWRQAVVFDTDGERSTMFNPTRNVFGHVTWASPQPGQAYTLTARATGGASLRLALASCDATQVPIDSGELKNGQRFAFTWPIKFCGSRLTTTSGDRGESSVAGELWPDGVD